MAASFSIDEVISAVRSASKYADIHEDLIRAVAAREIAKNQPFKETVKAVRNKLHQVGSAYQEVPIPYSTLQAELTNLPDQLSDPLTRARLKEFMSRHASTKERLSILDVFFQQTLASLAPVTSVLDVACGLNPLAIPWMPLSEQANYLACDIYGEMSGFLNGFFKKYAVNGKAFTCDISQTIPTTIVQVAFILKTIPCLEQLDKNIGAHLLDSIQAQYLLVSFPAHSLGGRSKGMVHNYEAHFYELTAGRNWQIQRFEFPGELAFLVQKS